MLFLYRIINEWYQGNYSNELSLHDNYIIGGIEDFIEHDLNLSNSDTVTLNLIQDTDLAIAARMRNCKLHVKKSIPVEQYEYYIKLYQTQWQNNPVAKRYFEYKLQNSLVFSITNLGKLHKVSRKYAGPSRSVIYLPQKIILSPVKLGAGGFGAVKVCSTFADNQLYALKIRNYATYRQGNDFSAEEDITTEISNNQLIGNEVIGSSLFGSNDKHYLKMPLIKGHDGYSAMVSALKGPAIEPIKLLLAAAEEIQRLHDKGYIHCDIKPENIICQRTNKGITAKLVDLQFLKYVGMHGTFESTRSIGTKVYMAPEITSPEGKFAQYSKKSDIFAFGRMCEITANSYKDKKTANMTQTDKEVLALIKETGKVLTTQALSARPDNLRTFISKAKALIAKQRIPEAWISSAKLTTNSAEKLRCS